MKHYSDLEQYLGKKYASQLNNAEDVAALYQEARHVLEGELDVKAALNRMALQFQWRRTQTQN